MSEQPLPLRTFDYDDVIDSIQKTLRPSMNRLSRLLKMPVKTGSRQEGTTLNGKALTRSYTAAMCGRRNSDRYVKRKAKQDLSFSVAIVGDFSSSMNAMALYDESLTSDEDLRRLNQACRRGEPVVASYQRVQAAAMISLCDELERVGGKVSLSYGKYETHEGYETTPEASTHRRPVAALIKDYKDRLSQDTRKRMWETRASGGTDLICYAEQAWQIAKSDDSRTKVAVVTTDMEVDEATMNTLQSIADEARVRDGVTMIFIGISDAEMPEGLDNAFFAPTGAEIGELFVPVLISLLKAR